MFSWLPIFVSAVSEAPRRRGISGDRRVSGPGRFRYSVMKEAARVCGRRGSLMGFECSPQSQPSIAQGLGVQGRDRRPPLDIVGAFSEIVTGNGTPMQAPLAKNKA